MQTALKNDLSTPVDVSSGSLSALSDEALLSAWMDSEDCADYGQSNHDGRQNRETWDAYHLIGDVIRNPELAIKPSAAFRARLTRALDAELPIVAAPKRRTSLRVSLSGLAVAAAVASVVWMVQPFSSGDTSGADGRPVEAAYGAAVLASADDASLGDYLEAHGQVAGPSAVRQVSFAGGVER